jgi:hypothetical protein
MNARSRDRSLSLRPASAAALLSVIAGLPFAAQSGAFGPFSPTEHNVARLTVCEGALDVRGGPSPKTTPDDVQPEKGQIEYTRPGLDARLRITISGRSMAARWCR